MGIDDPVAFRSGSFIGGAGLQIVTVQETGFRAVSCAALAGGWRVVIRRGPGGCVIWGMDTLSTFHLPVRKRAP